MKNMNPVELIIALGQVMGFTDSQGAAGNGAGLYYGTATPEAAQAAASGSLFIDVNAGNIYLKKGGTLAAPTNTGWELIPSGATVGTTNLAYTAAAAQGTVTSSSGNDVILPLVDGTNAGLQAPADKTKSDFITATQAVDLDAMEQDIADHQAAIGIADGDQNMGVYTGALINDNETIKQNIQQLETAVEALPTRVQSVVANIAARPATGTGAGDIVFVTDASADATVTAGSAFYIWDGSAWVKFAEGESLDVVTNLAVANATPTALDITSSTGTDATLPQAVADSANGANDGTAGLLNSADKLKLAQTDSFVANIGDGAQTAIVVTHNLGTQDVDIIVREVATNDKIGVNWSSTSATAATLNFSVAPTVNQYRVKVFKVDAA